MGGMPLRRRRSVLLASCWQPLTHWPQQRCQIDQEVFITARAGLLCGLFSQRQENATAAGSPAAPAAFAERGHSAVQLVPGALAEHQLSSRSCIQQLQMDISSYFSVSGALPGKGKLLPRAKWVAPPSCPCTATGSGRSLHLVAARLVLVANLHSPLHETRVRSLRAWVKSHRFGSRPG